MATYADILPDETEQEFICGQSGSGKTTLIKRLLELLPNELIIIVDSKPDWEDLAPMFGKNPKGKPRKLDMRFLWTLNSKDSRGVYVYQCPTDRPAWADENVERLIYWALARFDRIKKWTGKKVGLTIVVDELGDFAKGSYTTPAMSKLIRQGRSKKIRRFLGSQRPAGIPQLAVDQSQRFCVFMLMNETDRKRMAAWVHPRLIEMVNGRDFWYYEVPRDRPRKPIILMHQEGKK